MKWLRFGKAPLVRVTKPPPNLVDFTGEESQFYKLVHQAEAVRRNAPQSGERRQMVKVYIEVAGRGQRQVVPFLGRMLQFSKSRPEWERVVTFDRAPLGQHKVPTEDDVEHVRRLHGALQARVYLETYV